MDDAAESGLRRQPLRLQYLDGLRGVAALYVVLHHVHQAIYWRTGEAGGLPAWVAPASYWMNLGHKAVVVFIVLSGYCLMLPVVRAADNGRLRGGFREYLRRRARRILPPYYAALALSLLIIAVVPPLRRPDGGLWDIFYPAFAPGALLSHLFLIHNLRLDWAYTINSPLWSVATEWQIYFLFPALLLPVWRRFGPFALVLTGFLIGYAPPLLGLSQIERACPWFVALFALGMAAAVIGFSPDARYGVWRERPPWGLLAAVLMFVGLAGKQFFHRWMPLLVSDAVIGLAVAALLIHCTRFLTRPPDAEPQRPPAPLRLLEARPIVALGGFSYSLYLIHAPLLAVGDSTLHALSLPAAPRFAVLLVAVVPLIVLAARLFSLAFERPFLSNPPGEQPVKRPVVASRPAS